MTRGIFLGIIAGATALSMTACGDDSSDDDGGGGGTGGSGTDVTCTPGAGGACQNEMDCPSVVNSAAKMATGLCGQQCLGNADEAGCTVMCIADATSMSAECSICYATLAGCARNNCLSECAAEPTSDPCTQCQIDSGCRAMFDTCSGLMTAQ
jgi:hypothetical protein